ncbi:ribbon-helix-helix domain-containing protein [Streptacidiphilus fuscans]|nr:CopG family transcriptional regulator [Streptacidiphilus fuscans]
MKRTNVYIDEAHDAQLKEIAARTGRSEAELIRASIERFILSERAWQDDLEDWPTFDSGDPTLASRSDEMLARGFGR